MICDFFLGWKVVVIFSCCIVKGCGDLIVICVFKFLMKLFGISCGFDWVSVSGKFLVIDNDCGFCYEWWFKLDCYIVDWIINVIVVFNVVRYIDLNWKRF